MYGTRQLVARPRIRLLGSRCLHGKRTDACGEACGGAQVITHGKARGQSSDECIACARGVHGYYARRRDDGDAVIIRANRAVLAACEDDRMHSMRMKAPGGVFVGFEYWVRYPRQGRQQEPRLVFVDHQWIGGV